jgi:hypothetical protein
MIATMLLGISAVALALMETLAVRLATPARTRTIISAVASWMIFVL